MDFLTIRMLDFSKPFIASPLEGEGISLPGVAACHLVSGFSVFSVFRVLCVSVVELFAFNTAAPILRAPFQRLDQPLIERIERTFA